MKLSGFLKLKEVKKRIVCIDFGRSFIKVVCLETAGDRNRLLSYVLKEFDASRKTSEEVSVFLKEILESNSINAKAVYLSISEPEWLFIKKLSFPQMPKDELLNAVKWQLRSEFTFNPDESISDLAVIRDYVDKDGSKKNELFCVFAKKDVINKYVSAIAACGLSPVKASASVFNYCGILNLLPTNPQASAILDIGHTQTQLSIYQKNKLSFVRNLNFSTEKLNASLVGALVTNKGKIEINIEDANKLLCQFGIASEIQAVSEVDNVKAGYIIPLMRPLLETVVKELERSFEYFKSESGAQTEALYLTGGGANLKNFDTFLATQLKLKVLNLPLPDALDIGNLDAKKISLDTNQLSSAIGLGLSASGINLLPREIKSKKFELIQKTSLRVSTVVIACVFAFSWLVINFQIRDYKKRLKIAKAHLESVQEIKSLKETVDLKEGLINKVHFGKLPLSGLLKLVSSQIPSNIILDELNFDQVTHTLRLSGIVNLHKDSVEKVLTDFMSAMEKSKFILEANLISSKEGQGVNSFEIKFSLAGKDK